MRLRRSRGAGLPIPLREGGQPTVRDLAFADSGLKLSTVTPVISAKRSSSSALKRRTPESDLESLLASIPKWVATSACLRPAAVIAARAAVFGRVWGMSATLCAAESQSQQNDSGAKRTATSAGRR